MHIRLASLLLFTAACSTAPESELLDPGDVPVEASELVVHQWGTYTSVQSSEANSMIGLDHVEEAQPGFVRTSARAGGSVNQQLEMSVLDFYGATGRARIEADFPSGAISAWFPGAPASPARSWDVDLGEPAPDRYPSVDPASRWAYARRVAANTVRVGREEEQFLFHGGSGNFERGVRVRSFTGHGEVFLTISNESSADLSGVFVLRIEDGGGAFIPVGALRNGRSETITIGSFPLLDIREYASAARLEMSRALEAAGLYDDEAQALISTWSRSCFQTPGVRVLYVAPRAWVDELFPLAIDPPPKELVRAYLGRIEVLTPGHEYDVRRHIMDAQRGARPIAPDEYGRFSEPKYRRALELIDDEAVRAFAQDLIERAEQVP